jgi:hypothetical protein
VLIMDRKLKHQCQVLTEEEVDETGAQFEYSSLTCLAQPLLQQLDFISITGAFSQFTIINLIFSFPLYKAWFCLNGHLGSQDNRHWSIENSHYRNEVPLHDLKVDIWCTLSARRVIGPVLYAERMNLMHMLSRYCSHFPGNCQTKENAINISNGIMLLHIPPAFHAAKS